MQICFCPVSVYAPHPSIVRVFSPDLIAVPDDMFPVNYLFKQLILERFIKLFKWDQCVDIESR